MKKFFTKSLIYILITTILLNNLPTIVFAQALSMIEVVPPVDIIKDKQTEPTILKELIERRTENQKYFLMSDDSVTVASYPDMVHQKINNNFEEIDNTLVTDGEDYKLKKNKLDYKFSKKASDKKILTVKTDDYQLKWGLIGASKVKAIQSNPDFKKEKLSKKEQVLAITNLTNQIRYNDILTDTDLVYDVTPTTIKESIILKNKKAIENPLSFSLDVKKSTYEQVDKHTIVFKDIKTNKEIYRIEAPYLYDSNFEYNDQLSLKISEEKNRYVLTLELPEEWLKDEKRVFPITIDPSIITSQDYNKISDTYIYPEDKDNNTKGAAHVIRVGNNHIGNGGSFRGLVKFSLPELSSGDQIINSTFRIYNYPDTDEWNPPTGTYQIDVHKMTSNWDEMNAHWSNLYNKYDTKIVDYMKYSYSTSDPCFENKLDITEIVKDWYTTGNNYGLMLKEHIEKKDTTRQDMMFLSSDTNASAWYYGRPVAVITYRNQTGLEDYMTYHQQSKGRAGTVYTNDYNGNLILKHNDTSTSGTRLPVSINHVYNTNDNNINIGYGNGYRLNLNQTIELKTIEKIEYAKYIDEDGTSHYFYKEGSIYKDEDGLSLTLKLNGTNFEMVDKEGNKSIFEKNGTSWRLKEVRDTNQNKITITYSDNYITSVTDATGEVLTLSYGNNLLTKITDSANRVISYNYTNSNLTSITYPDDKITSYEYNSNHYLTKIKDIDNSGYSYEYYESKPYRIKTIKELDINSQLGNQLSINYGNNATYFKDNEGYETHYTFNDLGHTISIGDLGINGISSLNQVYGKTYNYGTEGGNKNKVTKNNQMMGTINNYILNASFEDGENNFKKKDLNDNKISSSIVTNDSYYGKKALKINSDGISESRYYQENNKIEKGKDYTFSAYLKTPDITINDGNIYLYISYTNKDNKEVIIKSNPILKNQDYHRISVTGFIPKDSINSIETGIMIDNAKGTIYVDAEQLEEGKTANMYNLVENNSFNHDNTYWTGVNTTNSDGVKTEQNNSSYYMTGDISKEKRNVQTVNISGKKGDSFHLSYWTKTGAVRDSEISIGVLGTDNKIQWLGLHANKDSDDWQYVSRTFTASQDYQSITLYLCYYNEANSVLFDNITLLKDIRSDDYEYDSKGNLITSNNVDNITEKSTYDANNKLIKSMNLKGTNYEYEYDFQAKNRLTRAFNKNLDLQYDYTYDNYGNNTGVRVESTKKVYNLEEKSYYITSFHNKKVLDVEGGRIVDNTPVNTYTYNGSLAQKMKLEKIDDTYFKIIPENTVNKVITFNDEQKLNISSYNNLDNQKWKFTVQKDGNYLISTKDGQVLTLEKNKDTLVGSKEAKTSRQLFSVYINNSDDNSKHNNIESNEVYRIKSKSSNSYVTRTTINDTQMITQLPSNDLVDQFWYVSKYQDGTYTLKPLVFWEDRGLSIMHSSNGSFINNNAFIYFHDQNYKDQFWNIIPYPDGDGYKIQSNESKQLLTTLNNDHNQTNIVMRDSTGTENQKFYFEKTSIDNIKNGAYKIKNVVSNLYMGTKGQSAINSTIIEQQGKTDHVTQNWTIESLENGYYKIMLDNTKKVLTLNNNTINGTSITINDENNIKNNPYQQWEIMPTLNGFYYIRARANYGKSTMDVANGSTASGTQIRLWQSNATASQQFYFELQEPDSQEFMEVNTAYSSDGKFLTKETDTLNHSIEYEYNYNETDKTGTLKSIKDSKGTKTNYEYDVLNRTTHIETGEYQNNYTYQNDRLDTISHNGFNYQFIYDNFGNMHKVNAAAKTLITNEYAENNGKLTSVLYGNNQKINYEYDRFDRTVKKITQDNVYQYDYDAKGNISHIEDNTSKEDYTYDMSGRMISSNQSTGFKRNYQYDSNSNISKTTYQLESKNDTTKYSYDRDSRIHSVKTNDSLITYDYDTLSRLAETTLSTNNKKVQTTYTYLKNGNKTSTVISKVKIGVDTYDYTYDANGNIETVKKNNNLQVKYYYDSVNQLIKEDNHILNKTISYTYDKGGNILSKNEYKLETTELLTTINYTYDQTWKDLLTNYNNKAITYDEIGNPITYDGYTYTWKNGRQLDSIAKDNKTTSYKYNDSGIRTEKTVNGVTTKYYLEGNNVIYEQTGNDIIYYNYDSTNEIVSMNYKDKTYYYQKNIQNDIIGLLDENLEQVVNYEYDSWGNIISIKDKDGKIITDTNHVGIKNPYRYRGYRLDNETGLYYLQSRYYNSQWGRFINADGIIGANEDILGYNLFAYCSNNPFNMIDKNGTIGLFIGGLIIGAVGAIMTTAVVKTAKTTASKKKNVSHVIEGGIGFGVSKGSGKINAGAYKDMNVGLKNGKAYQSTTTALNGNAKLSKNIQAGLGYELSHVNHTSYFGKNALHNNPMAMPWEVENCANSSKNILVGMKYREGASYEVSNSEYFIGISIDFHMFLGGHFKLGIIIE